MCPSTFFFLLSSALGYPPFMDYFHLNVKTVHPSLKTMSLIQPLDQGVIETFKKYYLCHTFCQAVKASDESGATLGQFWKDYNIYKSIKNVDIAWHEVMAIHNEVWKELCPVCL